MRETIRLLLKIISQSSEGDSRQTEILRRRAFIETFPREIDSASEH